MKEESNRSILHLLLSRFSGAKCQNEVRASPRLSLIRKLHSKLSQPIYYCDSRTIHEVWKFVKKTSICVLPIASFTPNCVFYFGNCVMGVTSTRLFLSWPSLLGDTVIGREMWCSTCVHAENYFKMSCLLSLTLTWVEDIIVGRNTWSLPWSALYGWPATAKLPQRGAFAFACLVLFSSLHRHCAH